MTAIGRPGAGEYAPYFERYVSLIHGEDVLEVLEEQSGRVYGALAAIPESLAGFRYAPGKWSIREVVGHVADSERVFAFRALAFARGERSPLPSFDENEYARCSGHDATPLRELTEEFAAVRAATMHLLRHLPPDAWTRTGVASGQPVSVRALAFIMAGHVAHHLAILHDRYRPAQAE